MYAKYHCRTVLLFVCLDSAACLSWISSSFTCWSNPKQSNRRLAIQRCFPLQSKSVFPGLCNKQNTDTTRICQLRKDCNLVTMFFNLCWEPWGVYLVPDQNNNSQKVAQKVAKVVLLKNSHFLNSPKGCKILGPLLYENTFPKPFKYCPIWSHCVSQGWAE